MEKNEEKNVKRNEDSLRELWDNIKNTSICIINMLLGLAIGMNGHVVCFECIAESSMMCWMKCQNLFKFESRTSEEC